MRVEEKVKMSEPPTMSLIFEEPWSSRGLTPPTFVTYVTEPWPCWTPPALKSIPFELTAGSRGSIRVGHRTMAGLIVLKKVVPERWSE